MSAILLVSFQWDSIRGDEEGVGVERRRSSLDVDPLVYDVTASVNGLPWSPPVGATFKVAYLQTPGDPQPSDWKAGTFGTSLIGTVVGLAIVGPGSTIGALAKGTWYEWARITDSSLGIDKIKCVSKLVVE